MPPTRAGRTWATVLLAAAAISFCLQRAIATAWLSDDSFISFRYAANLLRGNGLVYNVGERVEGYTNLLWTLLVAGAMALGIPPEIAAHAAGIGFWLLLVAFLARESWRRREGRRFLPLAACLVLVLSDFQTWASGGLETSLFTLLSVVGVVLACRTGPGASAMIWAGTSLAAAVTTRPDGVVFAAIGLGASWFVGAGLPLRKRLLRTLALAAPLLLAGSALVLFKLLYYGDLFPTAFYAKSALHPYYGQGLVYVLLFFQKNWILLPLALVLGIALGASRSWSALASNRRATLVLLAAFLGFVTYVAHSGGDFMFARRVLPAMPFLFVVLEDVLVSIPRPRMASAVFAIAVLGACVPYPLYPDEAHMIHGVANEPAYYSRSRLESRRLQAAVAAQALAGAPVRALFEGSMCMFGYYSELPYLAESTGLTQYSLAKQPLEARGRVGHEKRFDDEWATSNDIHLIFLNALPPIPPELTGQLDHLYFGDVLAARIWIYRDEIMDPLRDDPALRFVPIEEILSAARQRIELVPYAEARATYDFLERYYFRTAGPEARRLADEFKLAVQRAASRDRAR